MAKQIFRGKPGKWITTETGTHVFIPEGSDLETALSEMAEDAWESNYTKSQYADEVLKHFTYADFRYYYFDKATDKRVKPAQHAKQVLRNSLEHRDIVDPEIDKLILGALENNVNELIINDRHTNWFRGGATRRIQLDIDSNDKNKIIESLAHEIGHSIDNDWRTGYRSSNYKSKVFGATMQEMLEYEMQSNLDLETINDEADIFNDLMRQVSEQYKNGEIDTTEYKRAYFRYNQSAACLADMCQAIYGHKECKKIFGYNTHSTDYFDEYNNAAVECFAELTSDLFWDKEHRFYDLMKQYCPDTVKIYHEIIEEVKKSWNKNT